MKPVTSVIQVKDINTVTVQNVVACVAGGVSPLDRSKDLANSLRLLGPRPFDALRQMYPHFDLYSLLTSKKVYRSSFATNPWLVRACLARNRVLSEGRSNPLSCIAKFDSHPLVVEAATSNLHRRAMRMSAVSNYDSGEIALGFSYVTLVEQVANLSITLLAIGTQLADVQTALIQSPFYDKDSLHSEIEKQLQEMQSNEQIVKARLEEILEQLKKVLFMTTQLSLSTQIEYHLSAFNRSGLDVMMAQLPGVIADAAYEIDSIQKRVHQEIQILSDNNNLSLGNTDIDKMLEEGKKKR